MKVINGIPRFSPDVSYSSGNFSKLREKHARLQLDSFNGTNDRRSTVLQRTNWPASFFKGKSVLECGCGAGPDTEVLLSLGASVLAADIAGLDVAKRNLGENPSLQLIQASIDDLPLKPRAFDIVFCHRVLQHTPSPPETLQHILRFVKTDGNVFIHSYARSFYQIFRWKYILRPYTSRMDPEKLYGSISRNAGWLMELAGKFRRFGKLGNYLNWMFLPICDYSAVDKFRNKSKAFKFEYCLHDTFDALSPRYDKPIRVRTMKRLARESLQRPFEIFHNKDMTLLRTIITDRTNSSPLEGSDGV